MIAIPVGSVVRLHSHNGAWVVTIAPPAAPSDPFALITRRGCVSASLTHDRDVAWPDKRGEALASAVPAQSDGAVTLAFESLADALGCHRRLLRETAEQQA